MGARRSERVPVKRRAKVEVRAIMLTWVAGVREEGVVVVVGGRVRRSVPTLFMYVSPGPLVRKKPRVRAHIVGSVRKRRVEVLRRLVFFSAGGGVGGRGAVEEGESVP